MTSLVRQTTYEDDREAVLRAVRRLRQSQDTTTLRGLRSQAGGVGDHRMRQLVKELHIEDVLRRGGRTW